MRLSKPDKATTAPLLLVLGFIIAMVLVLVLISSLKPTSPPTQTPPPPPPTTSAPATPAPSTTPSAPPSTTPPPTTPAPPVKAVPGAIRPIAAPTDCTVTATGASAATKAVADAKPGNKVCIFGDLGKTELKVASKGTEAAPIRITGDGNTSLAGLDVTGEHVFVQNMNVRNITSAPGIWVRGHHIAIENMTVDKPRGGDGDGVRFFGNSLAFRHNTISNTDNSEGHADCFQNYSTETKAPETHTVLIEFNRCENIANIGVISEGPDSSYGDGSGQGNTYGLVIRNNYFQANSAQAIWLDDVQGVVITDNVFDGGVHHAVGMTNKSTGARIENNEFRNIECQVGMDSSSKAGYVGPKSECGP